MQHDIYQKIVMNSSIGFALYRKINKGVPADFELIEANDFFSKIVGCDLEYIIGQKLSIISRSFKLLDFDAANAFLNIFSQNDKIIYELYSSVLNRFFTVEAYPVSKKHFVMMITDITDIQGKLQTTDAQIRLIIDEINEGIICIDNGGKCVFSNSKAISILGFTPNGLLGKNISEIVRNAKGELGFTPAMTFDQVAEAGCGTICWELNNRHVYLEFISKYQYLNGEKIGTIITFNDVNNRKFIESELEKKQEENSLLLRNIPGMVYRSGLDRGNSIVYISEGSYELTGYPAGMLINNDNLSIDELIDDSQKEHIRHLWKESIAQNEKFREEYIIKTASGVPKWVLDTAKTIYDDEGNPKAVEGVIVSIDSLKQKQREIEFLSYHDQLTGLFNRTYFENVKRKYQLAKHMPLTIMMIDINGLKAINETVGFPEGDKIILTASRIIESCCRSNDVIARTGGSSFVILMSNKPSNDAAETYNKIKSICNKYNNNLPSNVYQLHLSIGFSTQQSTEHSINEVRKAAEDAMYKNKLLDHSSSHNSVITSITSTMFERSRETELHAFRIKRLSRHMGELLEFTPDKIDELLLLSTLHDIGKVAISDQILNKPGPLTAEEWVEMKKHPMAGYRIAMASPLLKPISNYILSHHERWDGLGYPRGLKGVEIPLLSRVLSVIDAFDAMTEDRAYRKKMPVEIALKEIKDNSGTQFDPKVANIFVTMINESNDEEYK